MRHRLPGSGGRLVTSSLLAIAVLITGACYRYHVYQVGGPDGREQGNQPATEWEHRTLHSFAWGLVRQDLPVENCRLGNGQRTGIEEVRVDNNLGYILLSTVTAGLWAPLDVRWRCAKPPVVTDTLRQGPVQ